MLKTIFFLLLIQLAAPGAVLAQSSDDEAAINALLDAFLAGASRNDIDMHDRFWAEDLVYTSSSGERRGKAEIMASLREAPPDESVSSARYWGEDVDIRVFDEFAVLTFRLMAEMDDTAGASHSEYFNTGVFARREGCWRAITWQATRIPDPTGSR